MNKSENLCFSELTPNDTSSSVAQVRLKPFSNCSFVKVNGVFGSFGSRPRFSNSALISGSSAKSGLVPTVGISVANLCDEGTSPFSSSIALL